MDIASLIRTVPDTPKPGILFYDITPLLKSGAAFRHVTDLMYEAALPWQPVYGQSPAAPTSSVRCADSFPSAGSLFTTHK